MKKELFKKGFYLCALPVYSLLLLPWWLTDQRKLIQGDLVRWRKIGLGAGMATGYTLLLVCIQNRVCRTIYFHRLKCGNVLGWFLGEILRHIYRPLSTLSISTHEIGPGIFIQHGYCTVISARRIGDNVWINQGVTIGYTNATDCPTIGNNVTVYAGAKILGNVTVGDNVKVGANSVVLKDVPANTTVVGVPARIVRRDGMRVSEELV